ncbi:hypothetical protein [Streptomyces sp. NPDC003036]|uniref:DUF7919 family protein n=1 Tax=Streptomyces sp. NPDC003036 TaxID=3154442 RepID=UPI0033AE4715
MTYYPDFATYDFEFHAEPEDLTVGWLEGGYDFASGEVSSEDLEILSDIGSLKQKKSRGYHYCTLCSEMLEQYGESPRFASRYRLGSAEIRVVSDAGELYVAPNLILHYITDHGYQPPKQFLAAARDEARRRWGQAAAAGQ